MEIDNNWTFRQINSKLKELRHEYDRVLCLFKCHDIKQRIQYRLETRNKIFALKIELWQKERIWDYMNHYEWLDNMPKKMILVRQKHNKMI